MRRDRYCQKLFNKSLPNLHKKRRDCLARFAACHLDTNISLSVSSIGKRLESSTSLKHKLKAADYFIGNKKFCSEQIKVYQGLASYFWGNYKSLTVLVDWSGACGNKCFSLTASVVGSGRSVPIYQEVHSEREQENLLVHNKFLENLSSVIPEGVEVLVITDAGFHRDWFREVERYGWDFIGRVYTRYQYKKTEENTWKNLHNLPFQARGKATEIGEVLLGKTKKPMSGYLYSYKEKLCGRKHKKNKYPDHEKAHSESYRNGWILFSSLNKSASVIVRAYKKRMQIEQNFRDIKNEKYGIGLRRNQSTQPHRTSMLFFFSTIVIIILWWIGLMTEADKEHYKYQANTVKNKRVISLVKLGALVAKHNVKKLTWPRIDGIVKKLRDQYAHFIETGMLN